MSQPISMLAIASAIAFLGAIAISTAACVRIPKHRALRVAAVFVAINVVSRILIVSGLRFNVTSSMPLGIYRLAPLPQTGIQPGMLVAVCAPLKAAQLGHRRGYLSSGQCVSDTEPLLKTVVAIAGDTVSTSKAGITVNGRLLAHSKPVSLDRAGRSLAPWTSAYYRLRPNEIWLYADHPRSWDSRYWGPVRNVLARAIPLVTRPP